jgi:hypothetical protein
MASRFLGWAITTKLVDPGLRMTPHRRGTSARMPAAQQDQAIQAVLNHPKDDLPARDRLGAILVLVFGQQIEDVVQMTWDQANLIDEPITLAIGDYPIELPPPLDEPLRQLHTNPAAAQTAAHAANRWIFIGVSPGQHLTAAHLRAKIKGLIATERPAWAPCTSSPSSPRSRSSQRPSATARQPSNGTPPLPRRSTPSTSPRAGSCQAFRCRDND